MAKININFLNYFFYLYGMDQQETLNQEKVRERMKRRCMSQKEIANENKII